MTLRVLVQWLKFACTILASRDRFCIANLDKKVQKFFHSETLSSLLYQCPKQTFDGRIGFVTRHSFPGAVNLEIVVLWSKIIFL